MKKEIKPTELTDNIIKLISQDWMLISAGDNQKFNTMTASWGGVGYLWNKPVVYVFVRPERYTYEFIETNNNFSLSFFGKEYKKILSVLGSNSGREIDKMYNSGLTAYFTELNTPVFKEARITIECRKLYGTMLCEDDFTDKDSFGKWYDQLHGSLHKMYIAEIINIWTE